jgi:Lipid A core - O-antigen ligase and related enzymes
MLVAILALVLGCAAWLLGMRPFDLRQWSTSAEFWWAAAAFFTASIGTLTSFRAFQIGTPESVTMFRALPIVLVGLFMAAIAMWRRPTIPGFAFLLVPLFGLLLSFSADGSQFLMPVLSLLTFVPALLVPRDGYDLAALQSGVKMGVAAALLTITVLALASPQDVIGACRGDKCSVWGLAFGAMGTGNAMGMTLAAAGATAMLATRRLPNFAAIAVGSWLLTDLTASRSAMTGWVIGFVVVVAFHLSERTRVRAFVSAGVIVVAGVVCLFPLLPWSQSDFTGRAGLWRYALDLWAQNPFFGHGSSFWVAGNGGEDGVDRNYSTHSILTELLLSVGIVGVLVFAAALVLAARGDGMRRTANYATALIGITLGMSVTEVYSAPGRVYLCASAMAFIFVASRSRDKTSNVDNVGVLNAYQAQLS